MANFSLDSTEASRRLGRFLGTDAAATARIVEAYRTALPDATPSGILAAVTADYIYRRNTTREADLQFATAQAPVYAYVLSWRTPVRGGLLQSPHTLDVPFIFGTAPAAEAMVGSGPKLATLTATMVATWSAFAHSGDPSNPKLPTWARFEPKDRKTMLLSDNSRVASNPDCLRREALAALPIFEYNRPVNYPMS